LHKTESMDFEGMEILVLGLGMSGHSAARFCADRGALVTAADERTAGELSDMSDLQDLGPGVRVVCGQPFPDPSGFALTVPSPGIPPARYRPFAQRVWGDIELASRALSIPIIAVTGTNGKSTTVRLIESMLTAAGLRAEAAGNVGTPALSLPGKPLDVAVLEVSSFQLETIDSFRPKVAVILNITPDHLDRHGNLEGYARAKSRIFENQQAGDVAVLDFDNEVVRALASEAPAEIIPFCRGEPKAFGDHTRSAWIDSGAAVFSDGRSLERVVLESGSGLPSQDRDNALAAFTAIWALGVDPLQASTALMDFSSLPHRCEVVATHGDVTWVNDSKATNPGAAQRAIEGTGAPIVWIAGGRDKGLSYSSLANVARKSVKTALLIGEAAEKIERALDGPIDCERCESLESAVRRAAELSKPGDVVLLAPACASFDQFKNFEDRGECFRSAVLRLRGKTL
jgi:UDP-N-acetylmuramoylalanine--D-glutamate ligase